MNTSFPSTLRAVGFASLIQLLWLPALLVDAIDQHNQARRLAEPVQPVQPTKLSWGERARDPMEVLLHTDDLLGLKPHRSALQTESGPTLATGAVMLKTDSVAGSSTQRSQEMTNPGTPVANSLDGDTLGILRPLLPGGFTPAELLGGPLSLASLQEAPMPALARSERARWQASGDPLAPLSPEWREPMRQAMRQLGAAGPAPATRPVVQQSQMVHVPSLRIRSSEQVPVAIHADGTVQVLRRPAASAALKDIEDWSRRQRLPEPGKVVAAVVSLEPLPAPIERSSTAALPAAPEPVGIPPAGDLAPAGGG